MFDNLVFIIKMLSHLIKSIDKYRRLSIRKRFEHYNLSAKIKLNIKFK